MWNYGRQQAPKFKKHMTVRRAVGPSCQQGAHLGFGRTLGSADPLPTANGPTLLQRSLAVEVCLLQRCPAILSLNRGRGVSFELSHSTLIHSLTLKLSQTLISGFHWIFLLKFDFKKPLSLSLSLSLISLLQERRSNSQVRTFILILLT